jgi:hypothetical protein
VYVPYGQDAALLLRPDRGNPVVYVLLRFLLFGESDTVPVTHEILREAEPDAPQSTLAADDVSLCEQCFKPMSRG